MFKSEAEQDGAKAGQMLADWEGNLDLNRPAMTPLVSKDGAIWKMCG
jgi:hypothetical protein